MKPLITRIALGTLNAERLRTLARITGDPVSTIASRAIVLYLTAHAEQLDRLAREVEAIRTPVRAAPSGERADPQAGRQPVRDEHPVADHVDDASAAPADGHREKEDPMLRAAGIRL